MAEAQTGKKNRPSSAKVTPYSPSLSLDQSKEEKGSTPSNSQSNESKTSYKDPKDNKVSINISMEGVISPTITNRGFKKRFSNDSPSISPRRVSDNKRSVLLRPESVEKNECANQPVNLSSNNLSVNNNEFRGRSTSRRRTTAVKKMEELMKFEEKFSIADEVARRSKSRSKSRRPSSGNSMRHNNSGVSFPIVELKESQSYNEQVTSEDQKEIITKPESEGLATDAEKLQQEKLFIDLRCMEEPPEEQNLNKITSFKNLDYSMDGDENRKSKKSMSSFKDFHDFNPLPDSENPMVQNTRKTRSNFRLRYEEKYRKLKFIIFPDDPIKDKWDIIVISLLVYAALVMPYRIAFVSVEPDAYVIVDYIIDSLFMFDVVVNALSAFYDENDELIVDRWKIFLNYATGWLFIDLMSSFPFNALSFLDNVETQVEYTRDKKGRVNNYARLVRIPRLYKLLKMTKLARIMKIIKEKNKFMRYFNEIFRLNAGFERLIISIVGILIFCHITGCIWYFMVDTEADTEQTWLFYYGLLDSDEVEKYIAVFYYTVQTVVTVGYGDLTPVNTNERLFASLLMILGVFIYSFCVGALTSFISSLDLKHARFNKLMGILIQMKKEHKLGNFLFQKIRNHIKYGHDFEKDHRKFIEDLPINLKTEILIKIHEEMIKKIPFLDETPDSFKAYICPLLKPTKVNKDDYIFMRGDPADEMYFIKKGKVAAIIPKYDNFRFIKVKEGYYFGELDLLFHGNIRQYTFIATKDTELFALNKKHFKKIFLVEFREIGLDFLQSAFLRKDRTKQIYKEAFLFCKNNSEMIKAETRKKEIFKAGKNRISLQFLKDKKKSMLLAEKDEQLLLTEDKAPRNKKTKDLFHFDEAVDVWDIGVNNNKMENPEEGKTPVAGEIIEKVEPESNKNAENNITPKGKLGVANNFVTRIKAFQKFVKSARKNTKVNSVMELHKEILDENQEKELADISKRVGTLEDGLKALLDLTEKIKEKYGEKLNITTNLSNSLFTKQLDSNTPTVGRSNSNTGKSTGNESPQVKKPNMERKESKRLLLTKDPFFKSENQLLKRGLSQEKTNSKIEDVQSNPSSLNSPIKRPKGRKSVDLHSLFFTNLGRKRNSLLSKNKLKRKLSLFSSSSKNLEYLKSLEPNEEDKLDKADLTPSNDNTSDELSSSMSSKSPGRIAKERRRTIESMPEKVSIKNPERIFFTDKLKRLSKNLEEPSLNVFSDGYLKKEEDLIEDLENLVLDDNYLESIKKPLENRKNDKFLEDNIEESQKYMGFKKLIKRKSSKSLSASPARTKVAYPDLDLEQSVEKNLFLFDYLENLDMAKSVQVPVPNLENVRPIYEGVKGMDKLLLGPLPQK